MDEPTLQEAVDALAEHGNKSAAAAAIGIPRSTLRDRLIKAHRMGMVPGHTPKKPSESFSANFGESAATITSVSSTIRTLEDALEEAEVDLDTWMVDRHTVNKWDVGRSTKQDTWDVVELWQVKVWLKRRPFNDPEKVADLLADRIRNFTPKPLKVRRAPRKSDPCLLELSLMDQHFGKLAWGKEVGENYDLKIARQLYLDAARQLVAPAMTNHNIQQIVYVVGNDMLHVDNEKNETNRGTRQDVDGRWQKAYIVAFESIVEVINTILLPVSEVTVLVVPGNHDWERSFYQGHALHAKYESQDDVTVDFAPTKRKFIEWGTNMVAFTHGDKEKHKELPHIMASTWPEAWARTRVRHWHVGHEHNRKTLSFYSGSTFNGVEVRLLPSLCATDAWHDSMGYVNPLRASDAYVWSKDDGMVATYSVTATALEKAAEAAQTA